MEHLTTIRDARGKVPRCPKSMNVDTMVSNILAVYDGATPDQRHAGMGWYPTALRSAEGIALGTGLPIATVVGVMAALSPSNKWARNVADTAALCHAFKLGGRAAALEVPTCTFNTMKHRGLEVLALPSPCPEAIASIIHGKKGRKVRSFFHCIRSGGQQDVCIDGHAYNITVGTRAALHKVPSLGQGKYAWLQVAYATAAEARGVLPSEMQAVTWVAWRATHGIE